MPLEYKTYGCKFKCGYKHSPSLQKILDHEIRCWYNPKNKTCLTCQYEDVISDSCTHYELEDCAVERWKYRACKIQDDIEFRGYVPIDQCNLWKRKENE